MESPSGLTSSLNDTDSQTSLFPVDFIPDEDGVTRNVLGFPGSF